MRQDLSIPKSNFFFSGYFRIPKDKSKSLFIYQNDTPENEEISAIIFPREGKTLGSQKTIAKTLKPSESLILDTDEILAQFESGITEGTVLLCVNGEQFDKRSLTSKDLALHWNSASGGALFAIGPFGSVNAGPDRLKKNFFMFCPVVICEGELDTFNIVINPSSDESYDDAVELIPELSNLSGETLVGSSFTVEPFGCSSLSVMEHFGKEGIELLRRTGGNGGMTIRHPGHILVSYFGQSDIDGNIICGNHTQPPSGAAGVMTGMDMWKNSIKKTFPLLLTIRDKFRST